MTKIKNTFNSAALLRWWFPGLVFSVIVLGSVLVMMPQINQIKDNLAKKKTVEAQLEKAQDKVEQVSRLDISQLDLLIELAGKALPEHKPYFEVMVTLQQLAAETGIYLQDFKLDPGSLATESTKKVAVDTKNYVQLTTQLSIAGTTETMSQFIERLQLALPLITIKSINISQNKNVGEIDQRQAQLDLDLYYATPYKESEKVSFEPLPKFSGTSRETLASLADYSSAVDATDSSSFTNFDRTDIFSY